MTDTPNEQAPATRSEWLALMREAVRLEMGGDHEARDAADDLRERLRDVVMIEAEAWATGGGPGFNDRKERAWSRAREPFEP